MARGFGVVIGGLFWLAALQILWRTIRTQQTWSRNGRRLTLTALLVPLTFAALGYFQLAPALGWPQPAIGVRLVFRTFASLAVVTLGTLAVYVGRRLVMHWRASGTKEDLLPSPTLESLLAPDEQLLWRGHPSTSLFRDQTWGALVFSLIPLTAGCVALCLTLVALRNKGLDPELAIPLLAGILFLTVGCCAFLTPWRLRKLLRPTIYAATAQRAMVLYAAGVPGHALPRPLQNPVYVFDSAQLRNRSLKRRSRRRVDIVFGQEWQGSDLGGPRLIDVGFIAVTNWRDAEAQLEKYFPKCAQRDVRPAVEGTLQATPFFSRIFSVSTWLTISLLSFWLTIAIMLMLAGLRAVWAQNQFGDLWICLPLGAFLTALLSVLTYYVLWSWPSHTIAEFRCDGQTFSYVTRRGQPWVMSVDDVESVTNDISSRKTGRTLRGWWIRLQDGRRVYLTCTTSSAQDLVTMLRTNPGIISGFESLSYAHDHDGRWGGGNTNS